MERLVEECELNCPEEKQIQILEKCLPLLRADREVDVRSVGFLLLARILEKCSAQCLRAAQSRLGKKLVDIKNDPTIYGGIFLRQLLIRNPQVGNLHADIIMSIIMHFIDMTVNSSDPTLRDLSVELYSIRYGCDAQMSERLLATLAASITSRLMSQEERVGMLPLKSFCVPSLREDLCKLLFDIYSSTLGYAKQGQYLSRDMVMSVLESGLNDSVLRSSALGTIRSLCSNGRSTFLPLIPRVVMLLISKLDGPSDALFDTLAHISQIYGSGSTLFRHFYIVFSSMKHPLDEQLYGPSAARLISSVIETSAFLIKPEVLLSIQRKICEEIIRNPNSTVYREILTSFLSCTHELVPPPIHIARTILSRCADSCGLKELQALCDVIARPRIQILACHEVIRRKAVRIEQPRDGFEEEFRSQNSTVSLEDSFKENMDCSHKDEETVQEAVASIESMAITSKTAALVDSTAATEVMDECGACTNLSSAASPVSKCAEDKNSSIVKFESPSSSKRNVALAAERQSKISTESEQPVPKKAKFLKSKKEKPVERTTLMDGEASVEEILEMFCPE
ncbi:hypothetical protein RB195_005096 [Necator americanus]|uniref:Uncharacterized protein n=1 Tax=Necator americanus TaxID=51031 RepID=A0ABR1BMQ5_NECAM